MGRISDWSKSVGKALVGVPRGALSSEQILEAESSRGWWPVVRESFTGAWQRNIEIRLESVLAYNAVFACITLIASDIAKLRFKLVERNADGLWNETTSPAFSPVLGRQNGYQNHIQFKEYWMISKLTRGNTFALKQRDARNVVVGLYILDPLRVKPVVTGDGEVFYQLKADNLSNVEVEAGETVTVPASEIIHDRFNCLFHPLVGLSPIFACGLGSVQGLQIQRNAVGLFKNMSRPSGILTAPGSISKETAARLKASWDENFSGENYGKTAVLGDGLKFEAVTLTAVESQMIEQLKWTTETVCSVFHVPPFKVGLGTIPAYQNTELMNQIYYADCLQSHIEQMEACLDEGLGIDKPLDNKTIGVELDLEGLMRMDTASKVKVLVDSVAGGIMSPNEARQKLDLPKTKGGETPYLQQQNYSLAALAARDAKPDPFGTTAPPAATPPAGGEPEDDEEEDPEDDEPSDEDKSLTIVEAQIPFFHLMLRDSFSKLSPGV